MATSTRQIRAALNRNGIEPQGRLRFVKPERIVTDGATVVVKLSYLARSSHAYVEDLRAYSRAGVPSEQLLIDGPLQIDDQFAVVVGFIAALEPTLPRHAEAVGRLLRLTHDRVWPYTDPRGDDEVYCPDDWQPANVVITADGPIMIDLDLAGVWRRRRAVGVAIDDFNKPFGARAPIADALLRGYGEHPALRPSRLAPGGGSRL